MKDNKLKILTYGLIIIVLGVGAYYYYSYLQTSSEELDQATQSTIAKTFAGKKLETEVLKDKKFKELKKIVVEAEVIGPEAQVQPGGLKPEEIANIPRRHGNPFKPF